MSNDALTILRELQKKPENRVCVDCDTKNPQWASVSYGTFMCLECSGQHRGLSVQISFVRSVTMDSWSAIQLSKMQCGGNEQLNSIMQQYGLSKHTPIKEKYFSKVAEVCREKLLADIEGRPYTMPSVAAMQEAQSSSSQSGNGRPRAAGGGGGGAGGGGGQRSVGGSAANWQDWDDKGSAQTGQPADGKGEYSRSALEASAAAKESFFASKMVENSSRPEGVAPSQGGKYVGFGSGSGPSSGGGSVPARSSKGVDEVTSMFSQGWNQLSSVAEAAAKTAAGAVKSGSQHLNNPQMHDQLSQNAKAIRERAGEFASMGFGTLKSFYSTVATSVEGAAKSQGFNLQLGAGNAATGSGHSNFNSNTKLYNDTGISDNNGGGSIGYGRSAHGEDERSASGEGSYGTAGGSSGRSGSARQEGGRQPPAQRTRDNNAGFEGFGSADADGDEWGAIESQDSKQHQQPASTAASEHNVRRSMPQSQSSPELASRQGTVSHRQSAGGTPVKPVLSNLGKSVAEKDDDEWGKW